MKKIATEFAKSSQLFQGMENEIMSETFRWAPPDPEAIVANDPILYEPSTKPTSQMKWAVRYNQDLMKCLHTTCSNFEHDSRNVLENHAIEELGVMFNFPTHSRVHLVCDLSARVCEMIMLEHVIQPSTIELDTIHGSKNMWMLPTKLAFEPSVQTIASVYTDVDGARKTGGIGMDVVILQLCNLWDGGNDQHCHQIRLQYQVVRQIPVRKLRLRRHKPKPDRSFVQDSLTDRTDDHHDDNKRDHDESFGDDYSGANDKNNEDDNDDDSLADALFELYQKELLGDNDDTLLDEFENELEHDQHYQDLSEMDGINQRLISTVMERTQENVLSTVSPSGGEQGVVSGNTVDTDVVNSRSFEDELGEALLQQFMNGELDHVSQNTGAEPSTETQSHTILDEIQIETSLHVWKNEIAKSIEACHEMKENLRHFDVNAPGAILSPQASLVLHNKCGGIDDDSVECSFVSWLKPYSKMSGRVLSLDDDYRIVYPSHFNVVKHTFTGSIVVCPNVAARVRKQEREQIPAPMRRLQRMFSVISSVDTDLDWNDPNIDIGGGQKLCVACRHGTSTATVTVYQCAFCLQWWHSSCDLQLANRMNSFKETHDVETLDAADLSLHDLPFILLSESQYTVMAMLFEHFKDLCCQRMTTTTTIFVFY